MRYLLVFLFIFSFIHPALAACTSPAGAASQTRYDFTANKLYYCDNTAWVEMGGANGGGGITEATTVYCEAGALNKCTVNCPATYFRTGCSYGHPTYGGTPSSIMPVGTAGCECRLSSNVIRCYAYCVK